MSFDRSPAPCGACPHGSKESFDPRQYSLNPARMYEGLQQSNPFHSAQKLAPILYAATNDILLACVHLRFCTATCPDLCDAGDELDIRGAQIYLMKQMFEPMPGTEEVSTHIDAACPPACMTTLVRPRALPAPCDTGASNIEKPIPGFSWTACCVRFAWSIPYPLRFADAGRAPAGITSSGACSGAGCPRQCSIWQPTDLPAVTGRAQPQCFAAEAPARPCRAAIRLPPQTVILPRRSMNDSSFAHPSGVELSWQKGNGGCVFWCIPHGASTDQSMRRLLPLSMPWRDRGDRGATIHRHQTPVACGTQVKDYGFMFPEECCLPAEKAHRVSACQM